jgi:hypothetical protein
MEKHAFVIPTNKMINKEAIMYKDEVEYAKNKLNLFIDFFVFEDSNDIEIGKFNRTLLEKHDIKYMSIYDQKNIVNQILNKIVTNPCERDKIFNLLFKSKISYGSIANRIFLIANFLGYNIIHRRDADTYLNNINEIDFPIKEECRILKNEQSAFLLGGGYIGDFAIGYNNLEEHNLHELIENGYRYSDFENLDLNFQYRFKNNCSTHMFKESLPRYMRTDEILVEVGNSCIREIFKIFPCSTATFTNGVDYIYHFILNALGTNTFYHCNEVFHNHKSDASIENYSYHYGFAKSRAINVYFYKLYNYIKNNKKIFLDVKSNGLQYINIFPHVKQIFSNALDESQEVLKKHISILYKSNAYKQIAQRLNTDFCKIIDETKNDLEDYILLSKYWIELFSVLQGNKQEDEIY